MAVGSKRGLQGAGESGPEKGGEKGPGVTWEERRKDA